MPLRALLRHLLNNEQIVEKLADSYPVRRAAQLTAYMYHKGKELGEEGLDRLKNSEAMEEARNTGQKASRFGSTFKKELEAGFKDLNNKSKRDR